MMAVRSLAWTRPCRLMLTVLSPERSCAALKRLPLKLLLGLAALPSLSAAALAQSSAACRIDDQIPGSERAAIEATGLGFVNAVLAGKADAAYAGFTADTKAHMPAASFAQMVTGARQAFQGVRGLHVGHDYLVAGADKATDKKIICGDPRQPEQSVKLAVEPVPLQAHLLIEGGTTGDGFTFVLWLVHGQGWQVQNLYLGMSTMIGKSAADLWHMARGEAQRRHGFNAALLYAAANNLAERGGDFELGFRAQMLEEIAELKPPAALQGTSSLTWHLGGKAYKILAVGPVGAREKLYLMVNWQTTSWKDDQEAEARNRRLMTDFARVFPEYADVFAGVFLSEVARETGRGYRSFYPADQAQ
jgi:hypothetical protein